jgi:hypothetical protein
MADYPWAMEPPGSMLRHRVEAEFRAMQVAGPSHVLSSASLLVTLAALKHGNSIGAVSASVLDVIGADGLFRRIHVAAPLSRLIFPAFALIRYTGRMLSPAAEALFRQMKLACTQ